MLRKAGGCCSQQPDVGRQIGFGCVWQCRLAGPGRCYDVPRHARAPLAGMLACRSGRCSCGWPASRSPFAGLRASMRSPARLRATRRPRGTPGGGQDRPRTLGSGRWLLRQRRHPLARCCFLHRERHAMGKCGQGGRLDCLNLGSPQTLCCRSSQKVWPPMSLAVDGEKGSLAVPVQEVLHRLMQPGLERPPEEDQWRQQQLPPPQAAQPRTRTPHPPSLPRCC